MMDSDLWDRDEKSAPQLGDHGRRGEATLRKTCARQQASYPRCWMDLANQADVRRGFLRRMNTTIRLLRDTVLLFPPLEKDRHVPSPCNRCPVHGQFSA